MWPSGSDRASGARPPSARARGGLGGSERLIARVVACWRRTGRGVARKLVGDPGERSRVEPLVVVVAREAARVRRERPRVQHGQPPKDGRHPPRAPPRACRRRLRAWTRRSLFRVCVLDGRGDPADRLRSWTAEEALGFRCRGGAAAVPAHPAGMEGATGLVAQDPDVPRCPMDAPDVVPRLVLEAAEEPQQELAQHPPRRSDLRRRPRSRRGWRPESECRHLRP